ncbi:HEAT repeat domain-containing protein [Armatimonas sp.]|uniref:HEAT repeat domain-containing protein n=1 Tax=Armatimonas sp. TaxID=1872638 RepID=UPI003753B3B7
MRRFQKQVLMLMGACLLTFIGVGELLTHTDDESSRFNLLMVLLVVFGAGATLLWLMVGWLGHEKNRQINRLLSHLWQTQLVTYAEWPQALLALLALIEQTNLLRDDQLRLWWWNETYPILVRWLPRMLPGELGPDECRTLRKLLTTNRAHEDLHVAILLALGTARDQKAKRIATRLFRHSPYERVREAAQDCLKALETTG